MATELQIAISNLFIGELSGLAKATGNEDSPISFFLKSGENEFVGNGHYIETAVANCLQQMQGIIAESPHWSAMTVGMLNFVNISGIYRIAIEIHISRKLDGYNASILFNGVTATAKASNIIEAVAFVLVEYRRKRESSRPPQTDQ
ncbi:MAG: hypothetical protein QY314_03390 [Candidatus Dojkabacteria bacterium]|nr:MAG: hypothetical protein QY314_03390 [Candidatus Dojkabacteria bacterium]